MNNFKEADIGTWWQHDCKWEKEAPLFAFKDYENYDLWTIKSKSAIVKLEKQFYEHSLGNERYKVLIVNTDDEVRVAWINETHGLKPFKECPNV